MKHTFTKKIEISVEGDLPLLGYDLHQPATRHHHNGINEVLSKLIDGRITNGTYLSEINGKVYTVSITNEVHSIE